MTPAGRLAMSINQLTAVVTGPPQSTHPVMRATAVSSAIGLFAGLVLGFVTQVREHDAG
jgi:hypothetical protein